jgi:hypothetical protein
MRAVVVFMLIFTLTACSHDARPVTLSTPAPKPPEPVKNDAAQWVRVSPEKLQGIPRADDPLDGKRIVVTALLPPAHGPFAELYAGQLFWGDFPMSVKLTRGAIDPPAPSDAYELVTFWGTFKKGRTEPRGITSIMIPGEIAVDRFERIVKPARHVVSDSLLAREEPEHVVLDGEYGHGEERSAIDGMIWLSGCPTRPPNGPVRVDGWLFGKHGSYGHMNRYVFLLVANSCEPR